MTESRLNIANHNAEKLQYELENTFHCPKFLWKHASLLIQEYKDICNDLLEENKLYRKEILDDFII